MLVSVLAKVIDNYIRLLPFPPKLDGVDKDLDRFPKPLCCEIFARKPFKLHFDERACTPQCPVCGELTTETDRIAAHVSVKFPSRDTDEALKLGWAVWAHKTCLESCTELDEPVKQAGGQTEPPTRRGGRASHRWKFRPRGSGKLKFVSAWRLSQGARRLLCPESTA